MGAKSSQIQIRVSSLDKELLQHLAQAAGKDLSSWILDRVLPKESQTFQKLLDSWESSGFGSVALAEINSFFSSLNKARFCNAVEISPQLKLPPEKLNYLAAMVEIAAEQKKSSIPAWVKLVQPLDSPLFASELKSVRLHLLLNSPPAFRKRNIFVDATVGDQV